MYMGEYPSALDEKGRITVPRFIRTKMDGYAHHVWYMMRGFHGCVFLYPQEGFNRLREQMARHSSMHLEALEVRRMMFGSAAEVRPDGQGRMTVPPHLREIANLGKDTVLLGVDDHLELWNKGALRTHQDAMEEKYRDMAASLFAPAGGMAAEPAPGAAAEV